ncbi:hypothetical protein CHCC14820_2948 [Bacillus paralicheniformis]|nr:hypothetical protein CHCC14820_2948 [Bacillus paralicheniformis]
MIVPHNSFLRQSKRGKEALRCAERKLEKASLTLIGHRISE